jgi:hypothetical protein
MPDLHDETELAAGKAASRVSDHHQRHPSPHSNSTGDRDRDHNGSANSNGDPSPSHKDRKASESDPPKKKRKVNHGRSANQTRTHCLFLTDCIAQHVSIAVVRYELFLLLLLLRSHLLCRIESHLDSIAILVAEYMMG